MLPLQAASWIGAAPIALRELTSAPCLMSAAASLASPALTAACRSVLTSAARVEAGKERDHQDR